MSSPAIDYEALAEKARGASGAVDYEALANKARENDVPPKWTDQLGDFGEHAWNMLKGTVTGPLQLAAHPIDTTQALLRDTADEIGKGREAFAAGDHDRALEHFKYALPVVGPILRGMREETDAGKYGAALGDAAGFFAGGKVMELAPRAARVTATTAAQLPGKVIEIAKAPGGTVIAKGAAQAGSGGAAVLAGHPFVGGGLLVRGWENIVKGIELRRAAQNAPPPLLEDLAQSLAGKRFDQLTPDAQAQIRQAASQVRERPAVKPPAAGDLGPIDLGEPSAPGKSMGELIDEHIAARKAAQQAPAAPVSRVPIWQREQVEAPPAPIIEAPSLPVSLPSGRIPGKMPVEAPAAPVSAPQIVPQATSVHPPSEAYEGTYRAKRAAILADHFHQAGITYADAAEMTPESLSPKQWETLLGKDPETGVQYRTPSQKTIDQARVRLAHKFAAARNEAAASAAKALADEMSEPTE